MLLLISFFLFLLSARANDECHFSKPATVTCTNLRVAPAWDSLITSSTHLLALKSSEISSNLLFSDSMEHVTACYISDSEKPLDLGESSFRSFTNLKYLSIKNNTWPVVKTNTFAGLDTLEVLVVSHSSVRELESSAFKGLTNLQNFELTFNHISVLPAFIFKPMEKLAELYLEHNGLEVLEKHSFEGLNSLETLDLSHNTLKKLDAKEFKQLSKLRNMYLSSNKIEIIKDSFELPILEFLSIKGNRLQTISKDTFGLLPSLKSLDLSSNQIGVADDEAISRMPKLTLLTLSHNECEVFANLKVNKTNTLVVC